MCFWVYVRFLWHKTEWSKTKNFSPTFMIKVSKKTLFRNFWPSHFGLRHQTSLFKDENPGRKYMTSLEFLQRPKVSSNITVPIKNMRNDVFEAMCEGHPSPTSGITPQKKDNPAPFLNAQCRSSRMYTIHTPGMGNVVFYLFLLGIKKRYFKTFGRPVPEARPESPVSGMKIVEDCTWHFLRFRKDHWWLAESLY